MLEKRFDVRLDPDASREYSNLDNSVIPAVNKAIDELEYRADEVGKPLGNRSSTKLAGCKEIKLREEGIRIVFRITNEKVEVLQIVYILIIEERSKDVVFKLAHKRLKEFKKLPKDILTKKLRSSKN
jgi:mRNA interferase RelE/StbE